MTAGVLGAAITASVAVVVAAATQILLWLRAERDRRYERRRHTLIDVQDAALTYRDELRSYGRRLAATTATVTPLGDGSPGLIGERLVVALDSQAVDRSRGRLDVTGVRLDSADDGSDVPRLLDAWRTSADEHFLSPNDVTAGSEHAAWSAFDLAVAAQLQR